MKIFYSKVNMILLVLSLLCTLTSCSQKQKETIDVILPSTNIKINLPSSFVSTTNNPELIAGFMDLNDSSYFYAAQINMNDVFENTVNNQKQSLEDLGHSIIKKEMFEFKGDQGAIIEFLSAESDMEGMVFIFGYKELQNFIMVIHPKNRKDEIREILLTSSIDSSISIGDINVLGFVTKDNLGPFTIVIKNSLMIKYEKMNEKNELEADFQLGKIPKESFLDVESKDCVEFMSQKYFPNQDVIKEGENVLLTDIDGYYKIYKGVKKNGEPQFNYITMLRFHEFDIMCVGSSNILSHTDYMEEIIKTIQIE